MGERYPEALCGEPCASCWGTGLEPNRYGGAITTRTRCPICHGTGLVGGGSTDAGPREAPRGDDEGGTP